MKYIQEDKASHYLTLLQMAPLGRTPMDKKSGRAMEKYYKGVVKNLENYAPWVTHSKRVLISAKERGKLKPGQLMVKFDANDDPNSPLYKNAKTL